MAEAASDLASRWKRLGGAIIDSLISMGIMTPIMLVTGVFERISKGQPMTMREQVTFAIIGWGIFLILNGYLLSKRGQTIGKVVVKTKIVDVKGSIPNFGKLLIYRYLILGIVAQIPFVGGLVCLANALFIFGKERRCIHDYLAGTWVVNA
ncbi:MAG: RDD family protein [Candidatus Omnitrophica bacterium]|nr:RDD family protein [Candidatus Omnitrophota bacterium]